MGASLYTIVQRSRLRSTLKHQKLWGVQAFAGNCLKLRIRQSSAQSAIPCEARGSPKFCSELAAIRPVDGQFSGAAQFISPSDISISSRLHIDNNGAGVVSLLTVSQSEALASDLGSLTVLRRFSIGLDGSHDFLIGSTETS